MKGPPVGGFRGHPPTEIFEISSSQKRDFRQQRVLISFLKVKMPFSFCIKNVTKLRKNDANLHL